MCRFITNDNGNSPPWHHFHKKSYPSLYASDWAYVRYPKEKMRATVVNINMHYLTLHVVSAPLYRSPSTKSSIQSVPFHYIVQYYHNTNRNLVQTGCHNNHPTLHSQKLMYCIQMALILVLYNQITYLQYQYVANKNFHKILASYIRIIPPSELSTVEVKYVRQIIGGL